jgi:hypothetical protein
VLLAGHDEFILSHFRSFFFLEGGTGPLLANVLQKRSFKPCRFLVLVGDSHPALDARTPAPWGALAPLVHAFARRHKLDLQLVVMKGYGHKAAPEYLKLVGEWARGKAVAQE